MFEIRRSESQTRPVGTDWVGPRADIDKSSAGPCRCPCRWLACSLRPRRHVRSSPPGAPTLGPGLSRITPSPQRHLAADSAHLSLAPRPSHESTTAFSAWPGISDERLSCSQAARVGWVGEVIVGQLPDRMRAQRCLRQGAGAVWRPPDQVWQQRRASTLGRPAGARPALALRPRQLSGALRSWAPGAPSGARAQKGS